MNRLAIHATHEAAERIAGIGAVLDGILPQPLYQREFPRTWLIGPYHFPSREVAFDRVNARGVLERRTHFDSAAGGGGMGSGLLSHTTRQRLLHIAEAYGTRILFGERLLTDGRTWVPVVLANPSGIRRSKVTEFCDGIYRTFGFDIDVFDRYPAIQSGTDRFLERILKKDAAILPTIDRPYQNLRGEDIYGGVPFVVEELDGKVVGARAEFPPIQSLDTFSDFYKANPYDIELEFYLYSAPPLWAATVALMEEWSIGPDELTLFSHDWLGVPLFWAMKLDGRWAKAHSVYFAHETRICRLMVEGILRDIPPDMLRTHIAHACDPDGHDVSFYGYLDTLGPEADLDRAFPTPNGFKSVFYHQLNVQAAQFEHRLAVGRNTVRETELVLRALPGCATTALCPNGVPDALQLYDPPTHFDRVTEAQARLRAFAQANVGFEPRWIFTSVNRCELSKAPWRNVEFFEQFARACLRDADPEGPAPSALFVWLSRPKPVPTDEEVARWKAAFQWPKDHRARPLGDLRPDEEPLWKAIREFNARHEGRFHILYVNQFGWADEKLGALDCCDTDIKALRIGTDVELGLSVYEPFGIAPVEPFSAGAVCVLSDACGCAAHLAELHDRGAISDLGFVTGRFARSSMPPADVTLDVLRNHIEPRVYDEIIPELLKKLAVHRHTRLAEAQKAMPFLSWEAVVRDYLLPELRRPNPCEPLPALQGDGAPGGAL